ncbi:hypothetical protein [Thalassolituus sp.]|uniref:hypothetical protein n=1 Tax=Thalassolituus sp. TaxID=2030822 RepID=UPI003517DB13
MSINLPSRYEDLNEAYKGRLAPNQDLISLITQAKKAMTISGGIRFLPIFGESGSGKSSASRELSTHMPDVVCNVLSREEIESGEMLKSKISGLHTRNKDKTLVFIIDQYEENVSGREQIPSQFVEKISLLDRGEMRNIPAVFIWLTTSQDFRNMLVSATSRNKRILLSKDFDLSGPEKSEWAKIVEETFSFHNSEKPLSDFGIIRDDIEVISLDASTIGECIELIGARLGESLEGLQNISEYQVVLLWPVADSLRNQRVFQFSRPREGYRLNWDAWYAELNADDRRTLPLHEFNRTRLYFDLRVIPLRAADLHKLCANLEDDAIPLAQTYIRRFTKTHFFHLVSDNWQNYDYNPVRERESKRADEAKDWYETVTSKPTQLGKRIAKILRECGLEATHETDITTQYSTVRTDVLVITQSQTKPKKIIELKAYASENTMPSTIKEQIKVTLRRHAQLAGFLSRQ